MCRVEQRLSASFTRDLGEDQAANLQSANCFFCLKGVIYFTRAAILGLQLSPIHYKIIESPFILEFYCKFVFSLVISGFEFPSLCSCKATPEW